MNLPDNLFDYLKLKVPNFKHSHRGTRIQFTCPRSQEHRFQNNNPTATFIPNTEKINCLICGWKGTVYDIVRLIEPDKRNKSDAEITAYLMEVLKLDMYSELKEYEKYGWSLTPLQKNSKDAFETGWRKIEHKDRVTWIKWLNNGLNIGLNCELSGVLAVDVDCKKEISEDARANREEILKLLEQAQTLKSITPSGGSHYVFQWEEDLRLQVVNIANTQIDTRTEGQIVVAPSKLDANCYKWVNLGTEIKQVPEELKAKLLALYKVEKSRNSSSTIVEQDVRIVKEGEGRNNLLLSLGGALINKFSPDDTAYVLSVISKNFMQPPLPFAEIKAMLGSLEGYQLNTEQTQEAQCYEILKLLNQANPRNIHEHNPNISIAIANKYLAKFVKEGKALRVGRGLYQYKEKIEWSDATPIEIAEYTSKIPFFNDVAIFQDADCLILGGKTNEGKTTIALNIIKEMVQQGVKPYYVYNEAGSRFQKTAQLLNIEGKFFHCQHSNPLAVELEANAFTIIDWLCLENKAETDIILKHLNDELQRKRGILIVFTQLKKDYEWFAPNLIDHFPTFAGRYIQDNETHTEGHWQCDKIKEARGNYTTFIIPCEYNRETRVFHTKNLI